MTITLLRSFRIGQFAIFDFAVSYIVMYFFAPVLSKLFSLIGIYINREQWLWLTMPIALLVHILAGSQTPFTQMFLSLHGGIVAKTIIIVMLVMVYIRRPKQHGSI